MLQSFYLIFVLHYDSAVSITSRNLSESPAMCEIYILHGLNQSDLEVFFDRENLGKTRDKISANAARVKLL